MSFQEKLKEIYGRVRERLESLRGELTENLTLKPRYIEVPEKYLEALRDEKASGTDQLAVKIKAETLVRTSLEANKELNKVYMSLKQVEKRLLDYVEESMKLAGKTIDDLWNTDIGADEKLVEMFRDWPGLEETRRYFDEITADLISNIRRDYEKEVEALKTLQGSVSSAMDRIKEQLENVKSETRDHRKKLFRYLNFAEGVRTKGVKLYLPAYRMILVDGRGREKEIFKLYSGNLKATDKMIDYVRKSLESIDPDFTDSLRKYIKANYTGLRKYFLLSLLPRKRAKGGRQ